MEVFLKCHIPSTPDWSLCITNLQTTLLNLIKKYQVQLDWIGSLHA